MKKVIPVMVWYFISSLIVQDIFGAFPLNSGKVQSRLYTPGRILALPLPGNASEYTRYMPMKRNLKKKQLLRILGEGFDREWVSIRRPYPRVFLNQTIDSELIDQVKGVNVSLFDSDGTPIELDDRLAKSFENWLIGRASCPVQFVWKDLGIFFWPRWIKNGKCVDANHCSWPPGMHCAPAQSRTVRILRWRCVRKTRKNKKRNKGDKIKDQRRVKKEQKNKWKQIKNKWKRKLRFKCRWVKVPYPVIDECFCSC